MRPRPSVSWILLRVGALGFKQEGDLRLVGSFELPKTCDLLESRVDRIRLEIFAQDVRNLPGAFAVHICVTPSMRANLVRDIIHLQNR